MTRAAPGTRRLRVAFVDHSAELSGAELSLAELVTAFADVDPLVILAADGPLVERLEGAGVAVEVLPMPVRARALPRGAVRGGSASAPVAAAVAAGYAARLARRLAAHRPDVVDAYTLKAFLCGGPAARLVGRPIVWHVNDRIAADYLPRPAVRLLRGAARHVASGVIANSRATLATLGPLETPRAVIHPGVVPSHAATPPEARTGAPFTVAMVGRIAPWKGQEVFVRAFAAAFPAGSERGSILGAPLFGEHEYLRFVERLIAERGLQGRLRLLGFRADVGAELARVDALVHASVLPEPFGRVVVEGMAAGLPVVAAAGGGPGEIVTHGVDGLLYPAGDVGALAAALARLAADPELARRLGAAAAVRARDFAPVAAARRTTAFYRHVLGERAAA